MMNIEKNTNPIMLWVIGFGIFFPLFFQLNGGVYVDANVLVDSSGILSKLPLPISIPICFVALSFLISGISKARIGIAFIAATAICGSLSLIFDANERIVSQRKLMILAQVIMPMGGLLLGQLLRDSGKILPRAFLVVLCVLVPVQLALTVAQHKDLLTHYFNIFSIYSHIQFVTLIFVCAFIYASTSLWDEYKFLICALTIVMFFYVSRSYSFLTIFAYVAALIAFFFIKTIQYRNCGKLSLAIGIVILFVAGMQVMGVLNEKNTSHLLFLGKFADVFDGKIPSNIQERFGDWKLFGKGILESGKTVTVGHPEPMPREVRSSPHNWYVEQAYNFGFIALMPILALIGYTGYLCWKQRKIISPQTWWLVAIVFYLVLIDSNLKVTLRQPYPGIFTYFMWGMLLSQLHDQEFSE